MGEELAVCMENLVQHVLTMASHWGLAVEQSAECTHVLFRLAFQINLREISVVEMEVEVVALASCGKDSALLGVGTDQVEVSVP